MLLINLFMVVFELFIELYLGGSYMVLGYYLFFGLYGVNVLVLWIWMVVGMGVVFVIMFLWFGVVGCFVWLMVVCVLVFMGIWIEKGMGLIVLVFILLMLYEIVEYFLSLVEW